MSAPVERPERPTSHLVWRALSDAIRKGTKLVPFDASEQGGPWVEGQAPAPAQHRTFQLTPQGKTYLGRMRDGDILTQKRVFLVAARHEYRAGDHESSWEDADRDFEALEDALLTGVESTWFEVELGPATAAIKGHVIMQTLTVTTTFERQLPQMQE